MAQAQRVSYKDRLGTQTKPVWVDTCNKKCTKIMIWHFDKKIKRIKERNQRKQKKEITRTVLNPARMIAGSWSEIFLRDFITNNKFETSCSSIYKSRWYITKKATFDADKSAHSLITLTAVTCLLRSSSSWRVRVWIWARSLSIWASSFSRFSRSYSSWASSSRMTLNQQT